MNKFYTFIALTIPAFLLVSFSNNPPDGMTGAPGDSFCTECHIQGNPGIDGTISVDGFPASITPNQTYLLTVTNRNTVGDAVRGGFQMTILGPVNTKAGEMSMASSSSIVTTFGGRQYFEHNPSLEYPDSNVLKWTVQWTAPNLPAGSQITYFIAGNIANGNFQNTGDRIVGTNGSGSIILSGTEDLNLQKPKLYPNPGTDQIHIELADQTRPDGTGIFYNITGVRVGVAEIHQGKIEVPEMPSGLYLLEINEGGFTHFVRWTKF